MSAHIKEDVRAALEWTAAVLQRLSNGFISERSLFVIDGVKKTMAEILDMADAALAAQQQEGEPVAHMYPSDLERFQTSETFAHAYSVAVGNPEERSVPLYTHPASAEREARWMPIETAPKDGTEITIACIADGVVFDLCNGHIEVVKEDEDDGPWDIRDGEPWCSYKGRSAGTYFCCWLPGKEWESGWTMGADFEYTHWMPTPPARAALEGK